jgi:hypothetical protein
VRLNEYRARVQLTRALTELVSGSIVWSLFPALGPSSGLKIVVIGSTCGGVCCAVPCLCEDEYRAQE